MIVEHSVKKLWGGSVSLRDYLIRRAIDEGQTLRVIYQGDYMDLTPDDLKAKAYQTTKQAFKSKINGKTYNLIDYRWKPCGRVMNAEA